MSTTVVGLWLGLAVTAAADGALLYGGWLVARRYWADARASVRLAAAATIAVCERQTVVDFGTIRLDEQDRVQSYVEKPSYRYLVSMGVNVFDRKVIRHIRPGEALGIPELIARLRGAGLPVIGFRNRASWLDIGRPQDYQEAQDIFADPKRRRAYLRT